MVGQVRFEESAKRKVAGSSYRPCTTEYSTTACKPTICGGGHETHIWVRERVWNERLWDHADVATTRIHECCDSMLVGVHRLVFI